MQIVFQDPYASLDPRHDGRRHRRRADEIHELHGDHQERGRELLELVGLSPGARQPLPHEFSGGQRQRVGDRPGARPRPVVLVLDEPVSALDVSIQAGVVNLLEELQDRLGLAYLFIAHDLSVVRHISDDVAVMYLGKIVEIGTGRRRLHHARAPVHAGPAVGRSPSPTRRGAPAQADRAQGRHPQPDQPAAGAGSAPGAGRRRTSAPRRSRR